MKKYMMMMALLLLLASCNKSQPLEEPTTLDFQPVQVNFNMEVIDSDMMVVKESIVQGYKSIFYKLDNEGDIYGGIYIDDELHSVGLLSMNSTPDDRLEMTESNIFGKNLIKFSGTPGANYAKTVYLEVEDNFVSSLIEVDGNAIEIDLDQDGMSEIITTIGTTPNTSIYRFLNNQIHVSNLNDSLSANAVIYNLEEEKFQVFFEDGDSKRYDYKDGKFVEHK